MQLTAKFNKAEVRLSIEKHLSKLDEFIFRELTYVGQEFVRNARINASFKDQTGALRSSIGYVIFKDGQIIDENFEASENGNDIEKKKEAVSNAKRYASEIVEIQSGFALVVVAGQTYAASVESKGFDVLTLSSFKAEESIKISVERIKEIFGK